MESKVWLNLRVSRSGSRSSIKLSAVLSRPEARHILFERNNGFYLFLIIHPFIAPPEGANESPKTLLCKFLSIFISNSFNLLFSSGLNSLFAFRPPGAILVRLTRARRLARFTRTHLLNASPAHHRCAPFCVRQMSGDTDRRGGFQRAIQK